MTKIEEAEKVVSDLRAKLGELQTRRALLGGERDSISFEVHVEGDDKARKRLDAIIRETIQIDAELASLAAAIRTAEQRVLEAQAAERTAFERRRAQQALELHKQAHDHAKTLDKTARLFFEAFAVFRDVMVELNRIGATPNVELVDNACRRALVSASLGTRLALGAQAPNERRTFVQLCDRWAEGVDAFVAPRLDDQKVDAA